MKFLKQRIFSKRDLLLRRETILKRKVLLKVALPPLLIAVAAILYLASSGSPANAYLTATVERGDIEDTVSALGTLQPLQYVDVGTQVTGQLKKLHAKIGQSVKKGQLIAEIDPVLFASKAGVSEAGLQNAQALLAEKQVQLRLAQQLYDRNKGLYESEAVSKELVEQSKAALDAAEQQTEEQAAQVAQMRAQLKGDVANLAYTKIYAPMSGTVVFINAREGQTLVSTQQATVILRIADLNTMTVWAQVSEADVPKITVNEPVSFSPLGLPNRRWHSKVRQVLPTPEIVNAVVLYDVLFDVSNTDKLLQPQMTVQSNFVIAKSENTLIVPVSALLPVTKHRKGVDEGGTAKEAAPGEDPVKEAALVEKKDKDNKKNKNNKKGKKGDANKKSTDAPDQSAQSHKRKYVVRVLKEDGQVEERQVEVGVMSRLKAEVVAGLSEGENVIVGMPDDTKKNKAKAPKAAKL